LGGAAGGERRHVARRRVRRRRDSAPPRRRSAYARRRCRRSAMSAARALEGRAAIVTGAGRGVGRGIAMELARAGCRVAVNYVVEPELADRTVGEIAAVTPGAFAVKADVRVPADVQRMVEESVARFGRLDLFVNNAGTQAW